jgi:hypothetical protein
MQKKTGATRKVAYPIVKMTPATRNRIPPNSSFFQVKINMMVSMNDGTMCFRNDRSSYPNEFLP